MVGQLLKTEVSILMQCSNPNVVKMMKYLESENNCYLVMEYCNRILFSYFLQKRVIWSNFGKRNKKEYLNMKLFNSSNKC